MPFNKKTEINKKREERKGKHKHQAKIHIDFDGEGEARCQIEGCQHGLAFCIAALIEAASRDTDLQKIFKDAMKIAEEHIQDEE